MTDIPQPPGMEWAANWITVHSDASLSREGASFAFACRSSYFPLHLRLAGELPGVRDVNIAEALAMLYGIRAALWTWAPIFDVEGFFLRSDSLVTVNCLSARHPPKNAALADVQRELRAACRPFRIHAKHVKGHQSSANSTAAYMNNLCDRLASEARRR